jgi:hypothetical protein
MLIKKPSAVSDRGLLYARILLTLSSRLGGSGRGYVVAGAA